MTTTRDIETLLRDDRWLRRIARSLLSDSHAAEDAVQDAYVAALEGGESPRELGRWLSGVVRFKALGERRSVRRRQSREQNRWRAVDAPATDDLVAGRELQARIAALVLELDEPRRSAVHLAYIAGLPMRAVAEELGVAPSTATHHVARGLEDLRRRLDVENGGDRRAWAGVLAARFGVEAEGAAQGSAAGLLAACAGVLAAVLGGLLALAQRPASAAPDAVEAVRQADSVAVQDSGPLAAVDDRPERSDNTPGSEGRRSGGVLATVQARFLLPDGSPAAGLPWTLGTALSRRAATELELAFGIPGPFELLEGQLDQEGRMSALVPGHRARKLGLNVHSEDHDAVFRGFTVAPGQTLDLGSRAFESMPTLVGRLVDPTGGAITDRAFRISLNSLPGDSRGARVWAFGEVVPATGRFVVRAPRDGRYELAVESLDNRTLATRNVVIEGTSPPQLAMQVEPDELRVAGIRLMPAPDTPAKLDRNEELIGAEAFDAAGNSLSVSTRGSCVYIDDPVDGPMSIRLSDPRVESLEVLNLHEGEVRTVAYRGSAAIELAVTSQSGEVVEDCSVLLDDSVPPGNLAGISRVRVLRRRGDALMGGRLAGFTPGSYRLILRSPEGITSVAVADLAPGETRHVDVTLEPVAVLRGTAHWDDGTPMAGVRVGLAKEGTQGATSRGIFLRPLDFVGVVHGIQVRDEVAVTLVDEAGSFELLVPDPGTYTLFHEELPAAQSPGRASQPVWLEEIEVLVGAPLTTQVAAARPARLDVAVRLAESIAPRTQVLAFYKLAHEGRFAVGAVEHTLDDEGRIHGALLTPGTYEVYLGQGGGRARSSGQMLGRMTLDPGEERFAEFDARSAEWCELTIQVTTAEDLGPGVQVEVRAVGEGNVMGAGVFAGPLGTDGLAGPFRMPAGPVAVRLTGSDWADTSQPEFRLDVGGPVRHEVVVETVTKRVRVMVEGEPVTDARLRVVRPLSQPFEADFEPEFRTDAEGWVTLRFARGDVILDAPDLNSSPVTVQWPNVDEIRLR